MKGAVRLGELVLLTPGKNDITPLLRACSEAKATAVATLMPLTAMALANAEIVHLPVLQLPAGSRIRDVERTVERGIVDQPFPADRGARLFEIDAHNNEDSFRYSPGQIP